MEDIRNRIVRTNFKFKGEVISKSKQDVNNNIVDIPVYSNGGFVLLYDNILQKIRNKLIKFNPTDWVVIAYFATEIGYNTNVVNVSQRKIASETNLDYHQVYDSVRKLQDYNIIQVYNSSKIVINQNYIFRGDILKFYEDYKMLYPDQKGEIFD